MTDWESGPQGMRVDGMKEKMKKLASYSTATMKLFVGDNGYNIVTL